MFDYNSKLSLSDKFIFCNEALQNRNTVSKFINEPWSIRHCGVLTPEHIVILLPLYLIKYR